MMAFAPVTTLADLDSLDKDEMKEGYLSAECGDPEPGPNRWRSFWHGRRNCMMDHGEIQIPDYHRALVRAYVVRNREKRGDRNYPQGHNVK